MYSLNPSVVKQVIEARAVKKQYDHKQFMYYHIHRNQFNVKAEVKKITALGNGRFRDNIGYLWNEQPTWKNFFHMPITNYVGSQLHLAKPYSRKFLRDDNVTGIGGEFEMIIRHDGKRVDSQTLSLIHI